MTFERAADLARELREATFTEGWATAVSSAGDDPQDMADAFYAGPPETKGDAFDVAQRWLKENHPEEAEFFQEVLMAMSSSVAGELLAGVDDGLEVAVELAPEEDVETMAEAVKCKKVLHEGRTTKFKFENVQDAALCESCLREIGYGTRASRRLSHSLRRRNR